MTTRSATQVFVCYSHRDLDLITDDVEWMRGRGYEVWYDSRIHPGSQWADEIAAAIDASDLLLFFASAHSVESTHCKNELAYAADRALPVVTVFHEPIELAGGLKLTISRTQAIVRWQLREEEFRRQLGSALELAVDDLRSVRPAVASSNRLFRVSMRRSASFSGRQSELDEIDRRLAEPGSRLALSGQPGVGKTQLALEHVYRNGTRHAVTAWIRAEESATLDADFVALAIELGLADRDEMDVPVALDAMRDWLEHHADWLLVLDNVERLESLRRYVPSSGGRVLITSRIQNWGRFADSMLIDTFDRDDALRFLLTRIPAGDREAAERLVDLLGNLPLALEEAAAYMEATGRSVQSYVDLFKSHHRAVMSSSQPVEDYHGTLGTTLQLACAQLALEEPLAARLLAHLSFLAADDVPVDLLQQIDLAPDADGMPMEILVDRCIMALRRYSLIRVHDDGVSTHRLTQLVARDDLEASAQQEVVAATLALLRRSFPRVTEMAQAASRCRRLLPHALAILGHTRGVPALAVDSGVLRGRTGTYLSAQNQSQEAGEQLAIAYSALRGVKGEEAKFARTCELYGRILYDRGDLDHASQTFREALAAFETEGPTGLTHLMQIQVDLSWVSWTRGDLETARAYAEQSLSLLESLLGTASPMRAVALSMIARLNTELGRFDLAAGQIEEVVAAIPDIPELDRASEPLLCAVFLQVAQVLQSLGYPLRAESWGQEALSLGRTILSEHHTLMGATHCVLGQAMLDCEDHERALQEFSAAAECVRRHAHPVSQHILVGQCMKAITLTQLGRTDEARGVIADDLQGFERKLAGDGSLVRAYAQLARAMLDGALGELEAAIDAARLADDELLYRYQETSPYRLHPLAVLAGFHERAGQFAEAAEVHRAALAIGEHHALMLHPRIARHLEGLSRVSLALDDADGARSLLGRAREAYEGRLGPANEPLMRIRALTRDVSR